VSEHVVDLSVIDLRVKRHASKFFGNENLVIPSKLVGNKNLVILSSGMNSVNLFSHIKELVGNRNEEQSQQSNPFLL
jgi:hypothetical protein